jgi:hypothetical protein
LNEPPAIGEQVHGQRVSVIGVTRPAERIAPGARQ